MNSPDASTDVVAVSQRYRSLLHLTESISSHTNINDFFKELPALLRPVINFDAVAVALHDPEKDVMRLHIFESIIPIADKPLKGEAGPASSSPEGVVWQTQKPMLIRSVKNETRFPEYMDRIRAEDINTLYSIPLTSSGRRLGAMAFGSRRENAYDESDLELLQQVAKQVAVAIDNVQNFQNAATERDRNQVLLEINNAVASNLDLHQLSAAISRTLQDIVPHDATGLAVWDEEIDQLRMHSVYVGKTIDIPEGIPIPMEGTPAGITFTTRQTVIRDRVDFEEFHFPLFRQMIRMLGLVSGCSVPLFLEDRVVGVLSLSSTREAAFSRQDANLLEQIGGQLAIAVENAINFRRAERNFQRANRARERTRLLLEINNAVVSHLDLKQLVKTVSATLREIMPHDAAGIALYEPGLNQLREYSNVSYGDVEAFREGDTIPIEGTPAGRVFITGQPLLIKRPNPAEYPADRYSQYPAKGSPKSGCLALLMSHGQKLGIAGVSSTEEERFTEDDLELFSQISGQIALAVENSLQYREIETLKNRLAGEKLYLEEEIKSQYNFAEIVGQSAALREVLSQVETVAPTDSTVLLIGETGTGKELIARAIHDLSSRNERTLVKLNCAAIPTGLLESELFGHEKGAFTGAIAPRIGRFELAHRGTLLLDEIGEIPLELQPKLLRVLQEHEFERLGSSRTIKTDARLVAATNCDLAQMVEEKKFRSDLFYRLNVFPIMIPPLRERKGDIPLLVSYFTQKHSRRMNKKIQTIPAQTMEALNSYHWPGNVRELENFIERSVILSRGPDLQSPLAELQVPGGNSSDGHAAASKPKLTTMDEMERAYIEEVLRHTKGSIGGAGGAAEILGLPASTLRGRMKKLGIR